MPKTQLIKLKFVEFMSEQEKWLVGQEVELLAQFERNGFKKAVVAQGCCYYIIDFEMLTI